MDKEYFDMIDALVSANQLDKEFSYTLSDLLKYKKEVDDILSRENDLVSFSSPISKDIFMNFYPEKEKYKIDDRKIALYYFYLARLYDAEKNQHEALANYLNVIRLTKTNCYMFVEVINRIRATKEKNLYALLPTLYAEGFKYCVSRYDLASLLYSYGVYMNDFGRIDVSLCCFDLANKFYPSTFVQETINDFSKHVSYSKCTSKNSVKLFSKKYGFISHIDNKYVDFLISCVSSAVAQKNKGAIDYYLDLLSIADDRYLGEYQKFKKGKKISILPSENPIQLAFKEFAIQSGTFETIKLPSLSSFLKTLVTDVSKAIMKCDTKEEALEMVLKDYGLFDDKDNLSRNITYFYYAYDYLNIKKPQYLLDALKVERSNFFKTNGIEESLKSIMNEKHVSRDQAIARFLLNASAAYMHKAYTPYEIAVVFLFMGYRLLPDFLLKNRTTQAKANWICLDDDDKKYYLFANGDNICLKKL